jgi:threonylcarbamoyladenosine tRNA methylthiotransferase MtaB
LKENLLKMKISVLTLGCKVNQSESTFIEGHLTENGHCLVSLSEYPDICIINTCTVTAKSDYQSRQLIRRALRNSPQVIVTGCYAELNREKILSMGEAIQVIENKNKLNIINILSVETISSTFNYSTRARPYVKIQDGCNSACSYCIVPQARGKSRSVPVPDVIERIHNFENAGFHEVVLTGINIGLYGYDLSHKVTLSDLLETILMKTKIKRVRVSSLEMNEINEKILEIFSESRICRHFHLPLQSGDDTILKLMNRNYTASKYMNAVDQIIKRVPGIALGTDVVVGFPGEGNGEFFNTMKMLEELPFSYFHIFPYSIRPNTRASQMPNQVAPDIRKERCSELERLKIAKKTTYSEIQIGRRLDIIIEEHDKKNTSLGTSSNYLRVRVMGNRHPVRTLVPVVIAGRENTLLTGKPLQHN